jgi:uncharacterized protein
MTRPAPLDAPRRMLGLLLVLTLVLLAAGCGNDAPPSDSTPTAAISPDGSVGGGSAGNGGDPGTDPLDKTARIVPTADDSTTPGQFKLSQGVETMDEYLTLVIQNVADYWSETLTAAGLPNTFVYYTWLETGETSTTKCSGPGADDLSAFYCPADDTIYVGTEYALRIWNGLNGEGETDVLPGDFGVAQTIGHEFGHNIQTELKIYATHEGQFDTVRPFELQADCLAGTWSNAAYWDGLLEGTDVEEALEARYRVGDFETTDPNHHGTPTERKTAWKLGYDTGSPAECNTYTQNG